MNGQTERQRHRFSVEQRKEMQIEGVKEVESFDDRGITLQTVGGDMTVEGEGLRIGVLDMERGVVSISGRIDAVYYATEDETGKRGFFGRLFR